MALQKVDLDTPQPGGLFGDPTRLAWKKHNENLDEIELLVDGAEQSGAAAVARVVELEDSLGDAAFAASASFASSIQGSKAETAVQPAALAQAADGLQAQIETLAAAQQTSAIYANTLADMQAVVGTYVNQGAFVANGAGAGQYRWDGAAWQFLRADSLSSKLDASVYEMVVKNAPLQNLLFAIRDANGRATWVQVDSSDGGPSEYAMHLIRRRIPGLPQVVSRPGLLAGFADSRGRRTWVEVSDQDGGPTPYALKILRKALAIEQEQELVYATEGDSMTGSVYPSGSAGTTYPEKLALLLGKPVANMGISGTTATEISLRAGGVVPLLSIPGGAIPADTTAVSVTWDLAGVMSSSGQPNRTYLGKVRGIPVRLIYNTADKTLTMARTTAGPAIELASPVPFVMDGAYLTPSIHVVWAGRNDLVAAAADLDASFAAIDEHLKRLESKGIAYLLVSVVNRSNEPSGSADYLKLVTFNQRLIKRAPLAYVDMRGRMIREGLALAGITPTSDDLAAIAQDRVPPSLMADATHFNDAGRGACAAIIHNELTLRGLAP